MAFLENIFQNIEGILEVANVFISVFVLFYAYSFLAKTSSVKDRKPWIFLFIASIIFFLFEFLGAVKLLSAFEIPSLRYFLGTTFIGLILFTFIFQYDLIQKADMILISKKYSNVKKPPKEEMIDKEL
jgi:hypothetical protein